MKSIKNKFIFYFICSVLFLLIISCGKKQSLIYNQPTQVQQSFGYYEKAWVDPQIKYTDSLITIIRANRVDSFFIDKPAPKFQDNLTSIAFEVKDLRCFTSVLLLNNFGDILSVLASDELPLGHYKVTLNSSQISYMQLPAERFFLKIDFCGFSVIEEIR